MFIENKYFKIYHQIIDRAKGFNFSSRVAAKKYHGYVERHHIIPKSLGGPDTTSNLVYLTAREHFICHMLLVRFTVGDSKYKMLFAAMKMMNRKSKNQDRNYKVSSRTYEGIKRQLKHTSETRRIMSEKATGRKQSLATVAKRVSHLRGKVSPVKGKSTQNAESKKIIGDKTKLRWESMTPEQRVEASKNMNLPDTWTQERKQNISKAKTGVSLSEEHRKNVGIGGTAYRSTLTDQQRTDKYGSINKGKSWKLIDGKRVWFEKEN